MLYFRFRPPGLMEARCTPEATADPMCAAIMALMLLSALSAARDGRDRTTPLTVRLAGAAVLLLSYTIALAWVLSPFSAWQRTEVLAGWALLFGALWKWRGRRFAPLGAFSEAAAAVRGARGPDRALLAVMALFLGYNFFRIWLLPVLNIDSYMQHLARAYHWYFGGEISYLAGYWPYMNIVPPNVHILQATWMKLAGSDTLVEALALFSFAGAVFLTRRILLEMGVARGAAAAGALLALAMPVAIAFAVTTQLEAPVIFFQAAAMLFLIRALRAPTLAGLAILGLSIGLLGAAKPQGLVLALGALAVALAVLAARRMASPKALATLGAAAALLPGPAYLFNWVHTGSAFAPRHRAIGFSLEKLRSNLFEVYPEIVFQLPFRFGALAWGKTLSYTDHDESNFGIAFVFLLVAGTASSLWALARKRDFFPRHFWVLVVVPGLLVAVAASIWKEIHLPWEARILSYGAYGLALPALVMLRRWLERPWASWLCLAYATATMTLVTVYDARAGLPVVRKALSLAPDQRTFANLSVWEHKPGFAMQRALDDSQHRADAVLVVRREYQAEGLAFLAGPGPRRRVLYRAASAESDADFAAATRMVDELIRTQRCHWIVIDPALPRLHAHFAARPEHYVVVQQGDPVGTLFYYRAY